VVSGTLTNEPCAELTKAIIGASVEVHKQLGPGLLESVYEACLAHELRALGLSCQRQLDVPVQYKGELIDTGFRMDMLVDGQVVLELKAIDKVIPIHEAQLLTYLRLSNKKVGLIINFNSKLLVDGITRRVL
jgi:GxxExxY protein